MEKIRSVIRRTIALIPNHVINLRNTKFPIYYDKKSQEESPDIMSESPDIMCRICFDYNNPFTNRCDLISPCNCKGSSKYVHDTCLKLWRFRINTFSEIKYCEQCRSPYKNFLENRIQKYMLSLLTITLIAALYIFFTIFFSSILKAFIIISNSEYDVIYDLNDISLNKRLKSYHLLDNTFNLLTNMDGTCIKYHISCITAMICILKMIFLPSPLSLFNYIFTYWRLMQFRLMVDNILFLVLTIYFIRQLFLIFYFKITQLYFIVINRSIMLKSKM